MAKARKAKLKVFRMAVGFHDAYVAAPSQKAALEAWGSDANLFAQGIAEQVTDEKLMKAPLARPGEVIKVFRGSTAEQIKALGKTPVAKPLKARSVRDEEKPSRIAPKLKKKPPKPRRDAIDTAERALAKVEKSHRADLEKLRREEEKLARRRAEVEQEHRRERDKLAAKVEAARDRYRAAMDEWAEEVE